MRQGCWVLAKIFTLQHKRRHSASISSNYILLYIYVAIHTCFGPILSCSTRKDYLWINPWQICYNWPGDYNWSHDFDFDSQPKNLFHITFDSKCQLCQCKLKNVSKTSTAIPSGVTADGNTSSKKVSVTKN